MSDLRSKLDEVLRQDKEAEAEKAARDGKDSLETSQLRKVRLAEEHVAFLSELFEHFVMDSVMTEYPGLFTVERFGYREAMRLQEALGPLKPSAEHRVVAVTFKNEYLLYVRFSAVILSRELEVVSCFCKRGQEAARREHPLEAGRYLAGGSVDWKQAFEATMLAFLSWYQGEGRT